MIIFQYLIIYLENDKYGYESGSLEGSRDQAAGLNFRWIWKDSKAEIYAEYFHNDSKVSLRDLLLILIILEQ